jgi:hypothetical protein
VLGAVCAGSAVLGVDVWGDVPDGLCVWAGAGPEGDVLSGLVLWATTQLAESSNKENSIARDLITVLRLRVRTFTQTLGALLVLENPAESLSCNRRYRTAKMPPAGRNYAFLCC